jgi:hypothetical protein
MSACPVKDADLLHGGAGERSEACQLAAEDFCPEQNNLTSTIF